MFVNNLELRFPSVGIPYLHDQIGFSLFHDMGNVFARPQEMLPSLGAMASAASRRVFSTAGIWAALVMQLQLRIAFGRSGRPLSDANRAVALRLRLQFESAGIP